MLYTFGAAVTLAAITLTFYVLVFTPRYGRRSHYRG